MKILILGSTSPIGSYLCYHLLNTGSDREIILHGRDSSKLEKLKNNLLKVVSSTVVDTVCFDYADPNKVNEKCKLLNDLSKPIDVVINCSFGEYEDPISDASPSDIYEFYNASLSGPALVFSVIEKSLSKSSNPLIINIVADWGIPMHNIMAGSALYVSGKYGAHGLGVGLQTEFAKIGVRTTNIFPGIVEVGDSSFENINPKIPVTDEGIHPKDIVNSIEYIFLATTSHIKTLVLSPRNPEYNGL